MPDGRASDDPRLHDAARGRFDGETSRPSLQQYAAGLLHNALLAAIYIATARFGLGLSAVNGVAAAVWPPTGISLAALLLFGYRLWPGVACGAVVTNLSVGVPLWAACAIGAGNTLEALLATYLLQRFTGFRRSLDRLRDVLGLVGLAALCSTVVSATIGVVSTWLSGTVPSGNVVTAWSTWWIGDAMGDLIVAPLLLTWSFQPSRQERTGIAVGTLLAATLGAVLWLVFFQSNLPSHPIVFILFPVTVSAALGFGPRGSARATFTVSVVAIWATAHGMGPFARTALHANLTWLQTVLGILSVTGLAASALMSERHQAERVLHDGEERFHALIDRSHDAIALVDAAGILTYASPSTAHIHGARPQIGQLAVDLVDPDDRQRMAALLADIARKPGEAVKAECRLLRVDDTVRWAEGVVTNLLTDPKVHAIVANYRDVTERKESEEALRRAHDTLERRVVERTQALHAANDALRQLSGRLLTLRDDERRRLGRELHEGTAQNLAGVSMQLAQLQQSAHRLSPRESHALSEATALVGQCSREIRTLSYLLRPPLLDEMGLVAAIRSYADGFTKRSGIPVEIGATEEMGRLPHDMESALFQTGRCASRRRPVRMKTRAGACEKTARAFGPSCT